MQTLRKLVTGVVALAAVIVLVPAFAAEPPTFRLPAGARPTHYALTMTVVPGEAKAAGEIAIDVELDRPHDVLWLNADSIAVSRPRTELIETHAKILDGFEQFVGIAFDPPLPAGRHRVTLAFEAEQSRNSTRGVFTQRDGDAWYTMTQFESISARRAFPCFDEPGFKTPWQVTLRVPKDVVALSNTQIVAQTTDADGLTTVRFARTRPLPTYLVAFAVGPWEWADLGKIGPGANPTRIVVPRGRLADTRFVAAAYPELFKLLESWFAIPYPFDKLDHVAIPLTVNFAMENAGLITYGSSILLAKPGDDTARFRRIAASVGAHEISHQWFGNLVTTAWWDDIWLNEAFATWIAEKIVEQWRPDYEHGAARIDARAQAIDEDTLASARRIREPVNTRGDIFRAFDNITYQKGATVIAMFEGWLGEEAFRQGVRDYLEARHDGSATAEDFLDALAKASRQPVVPAFDTFLNQNGVPKLDVRLQCAADGVKLSLAQQRLVPLGAVGAESRHWQIPVCVRYGGGAKTARESCTLVTQDRTTVPLTGGCPAFVFANAGGRGYYVPDYGPDLLAKLAANRNALTPAEFASLLRDLKALMRAGVATPAQAMQWVRLGAAARNRHVVLAAVDLAEFAGNTLVTDADRPRYSAFVRQVFGPQARALGFAPKPGESDDDALIRRGLLRVVASEDPALANEARKLALAWIKDRRAVDPGMVDVVLVTAARTGDAATFDAMYAEAKATQDRGDRRNLIVALFSFSEPALAAKGMGALLDPAFDNRESWAALWKAYQWLPTRRATHDYIVANFGALAKTVSSEEPGGWPGFASGLCSDHDLARVTAFWQARAKDYPGAEHDLAEAVDSIRACTAVRAKTRALGM
jgi:cytosol alanyl aminopeptidase